MPEVAFAERTLAGLLERRAEEWGAKPLVRWAGGERSYAEMRDAAAALAGTLRGAGVEPGDRVAVMASNRIELLDLWLACAWLGAVFVPINAAARGAGLAHVLSSSDPRLVVVEEALAAALPPLDHVSRLEEVGPGRSIPPHRSHPGDTLALLYTSGTTGPAKGVCCPHAQLYWYGVHTARALGVTSDDVLYTVLPLFHINALNTFWQALLHGATFALGTRFSASLFLDELRAAEATVTYTLGAMVTILLTRPSSPADRDHRMRIALSPGTPLPEAARFTERFGWELVDGYASTETNLAFSSRVPGQMGTLVDGFEARVVDEHDCGLPSGVPGELLLRAREPYAFSTGYFRLPEQTVESWRNLWFHTGDRVVRDEDGVFHFLDRLKDAVRRRGENISAYEVEQVLLTHADVEGAAVVPVASELAGDEEVMAFVLLRADAETDHPALIAHCEGRLAYFAIPRFVELVDELPLTENGKVRKFVLRERGVGEATWDREAAGYVLSRR